MQCSKNRDTYFVQLLEERSEDLYTICILPFGSHIIRDISRFVFQIETMRGATVNSCLSPQGCVCQGAKLFPGKETKASFEGALE